MSTLDKTFYCPLCPTRCTARRQTFPTQKDASVYVIVGDDLTHQNCVIPLGIEGKNYDLGEGTSAFCFIYPGTCPFCFLKLDIKFESYTAPEGKWTLMEFIPRYHTCNHQISSSKNTNDSSDFDVKMESARRKYYTTEEVVTLVEKARLNYQRKDGDERTNRLGFENFTLSDETIKELLEKGYSVFNSGRESYTVSFDKRILQRHRPDGFDMSEKLTL